MVTLWNGNRHGRLTKMEEFGQWRIFYMIHFYQLLLAFFFFIFH